MARHKPRRVEVEAWRAARNSTKLALIGDIHGNFGTLANLVAQYPDATVVQVGDFGFWPYTELSYRRNIPDRPVLFIDGNHDHIWEVGKCDWPNAVFVSRGTVATVAGRRVLFLGGATSVDRAWRPKDFGPHAWFEEEVISEAEVVRALANAAGGVDLMITHTPPDWMIRKHFSPNGLRYFNIDPDTWRDDAALRVEHVWRELGEPELYCGHMHRTVNDGKCHILNIDEVALI